MAHSRTYATSYSHLAVYVPITTHKARFGPTALTLWYHYISTSRLCYNGTLVWLSLTNTLHACHFSVVYNVRIAGVFIHSYICLSHFPIINCTHSFVAHCQYIAYHKPSHVPHLSSCYIHQHARLYVIANIPIATKLCTLSVSSRLGELVLRISFGSQFQTFGTAAHNTCLVVSVQVHAQRDGGASVDHRDRVITCCCSSPSLYGGTEVDRVLVVMTAILYWMRCLTGSQWRGQRGQTS